MSQKCPNGHGSLFDDLVGLSEQRGEHRQAERLGALEVDDESRTRSAVHWEIAGLGPLNNLSTPQSATPQTPANRFPRRARRPPQPLDRSCHARAHIPEFGIQASPISGPESIPTP